MTQEGLGCNGILPQSVLAKEAGGAQPECGESGSFSPGIYQYSRKGAFMGTALRDCM